MGVADASQHRYHRAKEHARERRKEEGEERGGESVGGGEQAGGRGQRERLRLRIPLAKEAGERLGLLLQRSLQAHHVNTRCGAMKDGWEREVRRRTRKGRNRS
eukprot:2239406-Rhodomonas_salina.2